jgi:hypothetical protein
MTISHSCCPGKIEMQPPEFARGATHVLPKGVMQEWICSGCRTVIYTLEPAERAPVTDPYNILGGGD